MSTELQTRRAPADRLGRASAWMLAVFVLWTAAFIGLSGVVSQWLGVATESGETPYIEAWLPWLAVTLLWVAPLVVGIVLAVMAVRRGAGALAKVALGIHLVILLGTVGPAMLDRLLLG